MAQNQGRPKLINRGIITILLAILWGCVNLFFNTVSPVVTATMAVKQFEQSDTAYLGSQYGIRLFSWVGAISTVLLMIVLVVIWWKPAKSLFTTIVAILLSVLVVSPSLAYYNKEDIAEAYFILPNESAFFIPDVGDNKTGQAKFGSEDYLRANKIPAKRYNIPHVKFSGSGGMWTDFYVPAGRLVIVDRTPYNREWTADAKRGSSTKDESCPCQSAEGINVTAEISISASVTEEDSPRFLYRFGVKPPVGDRNRPEVIFASVYYSRSLAEVMDTVGRGKVQTLVCNQISSRTLDDVNKQAPEIIRAVEKEAREYFTSMGITLDYIGWAGTFTFDKDVQSAINDRYTAEKIAPVLHVLQTKAVLDSMAKWDGKLPSSLSGLWLIPTDILNTMSGWFKNSRSNSEKAETPPIPANK